MAEFFGVVVIFLVGAGVGSLYERRKRDREDKTRDNKP